MAAPKGNQFWLARSSHGRNPKFGSAEALWEACQEYFQWVEDNPLQEEKGFAFQGKVTKVKFDKMRAMTLEGLQDFLDIHHSTWAAWREHKDFSAVTTRSERAIYRQKFEGASADLLNANIIARELGLADKQESDVSVTVKVVDYSKTND